VNAIRANILVVPAPRIFQVSWRRTEFARNRRMTNLLAQNLAVSQRETRHSLNCQSFATLSLLKAANRFAILSPVGC